jgi:hypothetical protein
MSDEEKLIQEFIRLRADNISFKEIKKRLSLPADFSLKQWNEKYSDEIKGLIRKNRENHKRSVSGTNLNEYEDKLKEREKQTTKDRFVSMMAKGRPKEEILEKLNLSVELFTKWSGELKNEIKLKSDIILTAKKVKQGKKRIKIFSKALLVLSAAFVIFSLTNGTPGLLQMIKSDKMSKCLRARAQMNYLTGQRLSLYPGGPVNRMRPHSRTTNRTALAEILRACEKDGFTKENTFMSVLFNTKQGKGDWIVDAADILSGSDIQSTIQLYTRSKHNRALHGNYTKTWFASV